MIDKKKILKNYRSSAKRVGETLDIDPVLLTRSEYLANSEGMKDKVSDYAMRMFGGFSALSSLAFSQEKDVYSAAVIRNTRAYKNKLLKEHGDSLFTLEQFKETVKEILKDSPTIVHNTPKVIYKRTKIDRTIVLHVSDTHYGSNIDAKEMQGTNEYDWTIAARRTAYLIEQTVQYKPQYRKSTDLVILLNGDILAGVIHNQEWYVDLLAKQFTGALHTLTQAISYASKHFKRVRVICTSGNHGRAMHKSSKTRASVHKWDSYETMLYLALKEVIEGSHKNINFEIPTAPFALFDVQGHTMFMTHGDTVITPGNVGKKIDVEKLSNQIDTVISGLGKDIETVFLAHVHVPAYLLTKSGVKVIINGSLSGSDPFAESLGILKSHSVQQLIEVTESHAVGDTRMIETKGADKKQELDKIIEPFGGEL